MNMDWHVSHTCRLAYHHLRSIAKVRNSLTMTACKTMVLSLVISRLDFGNATLYGISETLLHRLQVVQNSAARLIMRVRKREHITPILFALHWLPVRQRIQYKILTLVYRCLNQQAPAYLSTYITPYVPGRSLRSSDHGLLTEHRYKPRALRPPLFHRCRPSTVERTADPSERLPILPVLQGHTKNSPLPPSLQGPCVVLATFEHFKLFYLLCFYNYFTMHFNN